MTVLAPGQKKGKAQNSKAGKKEKSKSKTPPEKVPEPIYATIIPKSKRTGKKEGAEGRCGSSVLSFLHSFFSAVDVKSSGGSKVMEGSDIATRGLERREGGKTDVTQNSGQMPNADRGPGPQTDLPRTMAARPAAVPECKQQAAGEDESLSGAAQQLTTRVPDPSEAASTLVRQAGERCVGDKNQQQGIGSLSRSVSKEEARSVSRESGTSSPTIKQTKKTTPSVQRSYFSKLVSIQKQPDPKPLIKRAPSDTDKGRREAATPKTPRRRKAKEGEADKKKEVTPPYVKKKDPSKIREEAKSWLENELTRIKCKEQSEPESQSETEKKEITREVAFNFTCPASKKSVEIATSHSNWEKMALVRQKSGASSEEEVWSISLSLTPGSHTFKYFVDGEWCTDPARPTLSDSAGDVNNVVEVEPDPLDFVPTSTSASSLSHLTAGRPRAPQRRPPSTKFLRKTTEGDLTPTEEDVEAVVGKIEISLSPVSVTDMSQPAGLPKTAEPPDAVSAAPAPLPPDHNAGAGGKARPAETEGVSLGKGGEKETVPPGLETTADKEGVTSEVGKGGKNEVKTGGGSKAGSSSTDAGMGNGKSAAKGGTFETFPFHFCSDISRLRCTSRCGADQHGE